MVRRTLGAGAALAVAVAGVLLLTGHSRPGADTSQSATDPGSSAALTRALPRVTKIVEHAGSPLAAPVQDAAAAAAGGRAILLGGLTAADTSTDAILSVGATGSRVLGRLPSARHDTAAATIGGSVYLFGGGNGVAQLADIVRVDPATGRAAVVGQLPAASSDSTAAAIGDTAYVVGGYTGTRWLDTIVAFTPGKPARIVAHLPEPVRYAAVTAAAGKIVIAGGSLEAGTASAAIFEFTPGTRRVVRLGTLPAPTTHAAAASIGSVAYVIGGRGASLDTPTDAIVSVDLATKRVRVAGRLRSPRSDLSAIGLGNLILVAGGRDATATQASVDTLTATSVVVRARVTASAKVSNVYAHDGTNMLSPVARLAVPRIYVPNSQSNTVDVIDSKTFKVVEHFAVGGLPQHVVPAWNLKTLYVTNDLGNSLTPIDPRTGKPGAAIPVEDPYNMYFTPNGKYAIVVAERLARLDFRNALTFRLHRSLSVPCSGIDHVDFSADGSYLIASCEFSGQLVKVDVATEQVVGALTLPDGAGGMPQDVKLSPDGKVFYVADMMANGVWEIDGASLKVIGFLHTGAGAHGLYPSRDSKLLYVSNRSEGSISVVSFRTRKVVAKWRIPGGGSPDMGGVSADGKVLWLSGRYNGVVYAISTKNGRLIAKIPVGSGPHGLCVWPQPGRYSLGHTGILR
ncbi:MAG TPA: YncE family protein [Gaiellaceae bacterium]|nr:YncE family protein [Gaiellaceae bacterium]